MPHNSRGQRTETHKRKKAAKQQSQISALRNVKKSASNIGGASVGGGT